MRLSRLRGRKVVSELLRRGKVWKGKTMAVRWLLQAPRHPHVDPSAPGLYVGVFASGKLSKSAVERNRMRRRCREALRVTVLPLDLPQPVQLLLCPRNASLKVPFDAVLADVRSFLTLLPWPKASAHERSTSS